MTARASIAHCVPGRIRLKVTAGTSRERGVAMDALQGVKGTPGIESVRSDVRTGSALITYDPERLDLNSAMELVRQAHEAFVNVAPPNLTSFVDGSLSRAGATIKHRFGNADTRVRMATRGTVDLRALLPMALAGLSLRQLFRQGPKLSPIPWYVVAYYSFDSFVKLHPRDSDLNGTAEVGR